MNDSDQTTVKVHNFVQEYLEDMIDVLKASGVKFDSSVALHDIAVLRLKDQFDEIQKQPKSEMDGFVESLLNDLYFLQDEDIVKVKMRNIPKRKEK